MSTDTVTSTTEPLARYLHRAGDVDEVRFDAVRQALDADHLVVLRGLVDPATVREAMRVARDAFDSEDDRAVTGEKPDEVRRNFQKWSIGVAGSGHAAADYGRMLRVIFTPFTDHDRYGVHALLRQVAVVRNRLLGLDDDYAVDGEEDGFWTAAKLQQYPSGGGFIQRHVDTTTVEVIPDGAFNYVQVLLVLTQRGIDYERGGALFDHDGATLDLEAGLRLGDIVLYDEQSMHAVDVIDPHRVLDTTTLNGRVAGFANLYRVL